MPVRVHARTRVIVIAVSGDLDLVSRALLDAAVDSALGGDWPVVVIDLAELAFVDIVGARPLLRLTRQISIDRTLLIVNASPVVVNTLTLLELDSWIVPLEELPLATDADLDALLHD